MGDDIQFGDLVFDKSFLFARRGSSEELKFTRAERAMLLLLTANARKIVTRNRLLDAIAGAGSDSADRNVDFAINRLRAKLGDSARNPSFIATQYGEGYVWIAEPSEGPASTEALLVIGPVFGLEHAASTDRARAFLLRLKDAIDAQTADDQIVVLEQNGHAGRNASSKALFSLEVSFYDDGKCLHCAAVLRKAVIGQILQTFRLTLDPARLPAAEPDIETVVAGLKRAMWRQVTTGQGILAGPTDQPLELRMHDAARLFARSDESWAEMSEQLSVARRNHPGDPQTELMWAMHLYARILQNPVDLDMRAAHEEEIEGCVFDHLTAFQDNPIFLLGASKLLLFTGRGHLALAEQLAEQAFLSSTAFASAFAGLGQIRMCKGDIRSAIDLYDRGIELSGPDSEFRIFLMVLKCAALMADDDRPGLDQAAAALYALKPITRLQIGLFMAPPGPLAPDLTLVVGQFDASRAQHAILHLYYVFARLFVREEHRENIMRGVIGHLMERFGADVVPDEVRRSVPRLV
jgi:DNA-binding winged helix-turn-helix (wHTH) protein